jgi:hypothetical protein
MRGKSSIDHIVGALANRQWGVVARPAESQ